MGKTTDVGNAIEALSKTVTSSEIAHDVELTTSNVVAVVTEVSKEANEQISDSVHEVKDQISKDISDSRDEEVVAVQGVVENVLNDITDVTTTEIAETMCENIQTIQEHISDVIPEVQELVHN